MNELAIFAKHWQPGHVKTRLAAQLGAALACDVYRDFVVTLLRRMERVGDRRYLVYAPPESRAAFEGLVADFPEWRIRPQILGDLGARLRHDVAQSLQAGTGSLVILGTDSPSLPVGYVERAFEALRACEVVLGPTEDGGYYLVGLRRDMPGLFHEIEWSTERVWQQTLERVGEMSPTPSLQVLPPWYDIDELVDLRRLASELEVVSRNDAALGSLRRSVRRALGR
jgi:rSAM/selenodomain-associated transferase 1